MRAIVVCPVCRVKLIHISESPGTFWHDVGSQCLDKDDLQPDRGEHCPLRGRVFESPLMVYHRGAVSKGYSNKADRREYHSLLKLLDLIRKTDRRELWAIVESHIEGGGKKWQWSLYKAATSNRKGRI